MTSCGPLSLSHLGKDDKAQELSFYTSENCLPARLLFAFYLFFTVAHGFLFCLHLVLFVKEFLGNSSWHPRKRIILCFVFEFFISFLADLSLLLSFPYYLRYFFFGFYSLPTSWCMVFVIKDWFAAVTARELFQGKTSSTLQNFNKIANFVMLVELLARLGGLISPILAYNQNDLRLANILVLIFQVITSSSGTYIAFSGVIVTGKLLKFTGESLSSDQKPLVRLTGKLRKFRIFCLSNFFALIFLSISFIIYLVVTLSFTQAGNDYLIFYSSFVRLMVFTTCWQFLSIYQSSQGGSQGQDDSRSIDLNQKDSFKASRIDLVQPNQEKKSVEEPSL